MNLIDRYYDWRDRRLEQRFEQWDRDHRWDALADYNSRVSKGIVHTPEMVELMRLEQERFNVEHGHPGVTTGFPITLWPSR